MQNQETRTCYGCKANSGKGCSLFYRVGKQVVNHMKQRTPLEDCPRPVTLRHLDAQIEAMEAVA